MSTPLELFKQSERERYKTFMEEIYLELLPHVAQGLSTSQIARELNDRGIKQFRGKQWSRWTVWRVLNELGLKTRFSNVKDSTNEQ